MSAHGNWSWIEEIVRGQGLSISQFAKVHGFRQQTFSNWVRNINDPDMLNLMRLAIIFTEGSIDALLKRAQVDISFIQEELEAGLKRLADYDLEAVGLGPAATVSFKAPLDALLDRGVLSDQFMKTYDSATALMKYTSLFEELQTVTASILQKTTNLDRVLAGRFYFDLAYAQLMLGRYPEGLESANEARKRLFNQNQPLLTADTYWLSAELLRIIGDQPEAKRHAEAAEGIYQQAQIEPSWDKPGPMWTDWNNSCIEADYGNYGNASGYLNNLAVDAERTSLAEAICAADWGLAYLDEMQSRFGRAVDQYRWVRVTANHQRDTFWEAESLWRIAEVQRKTGQYDQALITVREARNLYASIGNISMLRKLDCTEAACRLHKGDTDQALALFEQAAAFFEENLDYPMERTAQLGTTWARLARSDQTTSGVFVQFLDPLDELESTELTQHNVYRRSYEQLAHAEGLRLSGNADRALEGYLSVLENSTKHDHLLEQAHAQLGAAEAQRVSGNSDVTACHNALAIYRQVGSAWGEIHSLITLGLLEQQQGDSGSAAFQEAAGLAEQRAFLVEINLIEDLLKSSGSSSTQHVLIFI